MNAVKDWTGNRASVFVCNGATGHALGEREENDYYATEPKAAELLCDIETFSKKILEPCCGEGHISKVLLSRGYEVESSDLIDRGFGTPHIDFLSRIEPFDGDVITNPPYKYAQEFVEHSLDIIREGQKVAMFLKLTFLEGKSRRKMFDKAPPMRIWVASGRLQCGKNGNFWASSATAYAWFVWVKGIKQDPIIKWFN